jgi:site-specific recombinase XerD
MLMIAQSGIARWRHSASTICGTHGRPERLEFGIDLVTLAAMLGHSKINVVLLYAHPTARHQTQAVQRMETWERDQQRQSN